MVADRGAGQWRQGRKRHASPRRDPARTTERHRHGASTWFREYGMRAMNIRTMLDMIDNEELVLPAMQRPFVWDEDRILRLMDSLMRTFPVGTVLIWEDVRAVAEPSHRRF
jgi:hypothetical protein